MRNAEVACGLLLLVLGLVIVWESLKLKVGWGFNGPEAGFFPFWLAIGLVISSSLITIQALLSKKPTIRQPFVSREGLFSVIKVGVPAFAMVALTEAIGLYPAALIYIAIYMRWIGAHSWVTTALVSVLIPLSSYFIFDKWFLIPMPRGHWDLLSRLL